MTNDSKGTAREIARDDFGVLDDGTRIERYTVRVGGIELQAMTWGAAITAVRTPDRTGTLGDVVLGFDTLGEYVARSPYFGAVVGRYGNRIAGGRFTLDGHEHRLATNDGPNHLHGGARGFDRRTWDAEAVLRDGGAGVAFTRTSPDGEEGYPGTLHVRVEYLLGADGALEVDYHATTDRPTIVNLTQHSYWNLSAGRAADILGHELTIPASRFVEVGEGLVPTGALASVDGTPFDFRQRSAIGARIAEPNEQLRLAGGYDHTFVLDRAESSHGLALAAAVREPLTGRTLQVTTTEPGVQLYSGNFLDGKLRGKQRRKYAHRGGFCLETQHFPDSPNHSAFPSVVLRPGETYRSRTVFRFGTD